MKKKKEFMHKGWRFRAPTGKLKKQIEESIDKHKKGKLKLYKLE